MKTWDRTSRVGLLGVVYRLSLVEHTHGFECHCADDSQALRAELIESVLGSVVKDVVVAVVEVNKVCGWNTALHEGQVIIGNAFLARKKVRLISNARRRLANKILEPWRRVQLPLDVEIGVSHKVFQQERSYLLQSAVILPLLCNMLYAIKALVIVPWHFHGFFAIVPQ